ncbi:MAG TPA: hypothetical protein VFO05_16465 [Candidatus Limnocylindrales bacterium]|nr:hypothetical protein [Candidatus Limnocylindrales bacterium]
MIDLRGQCARHRSALLDFVDRGEIAPGTAQALAHLDRCGRCTDELESTVLTITALRRIGDDLARAEPAPDAWPRLRARLDRWRPARPAIMSPVAGMVMSVAIVAVLVAPLQIGGAGAPAGDSNGPSAAELTAMRQERRAEAAYLASIRQGTLPDTRPATAVSFGRIPARYPDDIRPERKEVSPAEPSGRPPEAI